MDSYEAYAQQVTEKICRHFGIPAPKVKIDPSFCGDAIACYYNGTIYLSSPEAIREEVILHELLHYALDMGYATYECETCGSPMILNGSSHVKCYVCGEEYEVKGYPGGGMEDFLLGLAVGTFILAPFIYVPVLRSWAVEKISKGLRVARERVEEALRK